MGDPYHIIQVNPEWMLQREEMGSKTKFWYRPLANHTDASVVDDNMWLFKYPQPRTGQHWAEKIAAEVAVILRINHARVELAEFQGDRGSVTESFARSGRSLYHGNQVLERVVHGYDPEQRFRQSNHTLANIFGAMDGIFVEPETAKSAKTLMAEYVLLDAVIGNTDRHHENWGVLRRRVGDKWRGFVAPSFDHASSLGRELLDDRRDRLLTENRVGVYAEKGRGAIYWSEDDRRGLSPLELVRQGTALHPDLFLPALSKLERLNHETMTSLVDRIPRCWMSSTRRVRCSEFLAEQGLPDGLRFFLPQRRG